jgi:hypothetical protein
MAVSIYNTPSNKFQMSHTGRTDRARVARPLNSTWRGQAFPIFSSNEISRKIRMKAVGSYNRTPLMNFRIICLNYNIYTPSFVARKCKMQKCNFVRTAANVYHTMLFSLQVQCQMNQHDKWKVLIPSTDVQVHKWWNVNVMFAFQICHILQCARIMIVIALCLVTHHVWGSSSGSNQMLEIRRKTTSLPWNNSPAASRVQQILFNELALSILLPTIASWLVAMHSGIAACNCTMHIGREQNQPSQFKSSKRGVDERYNRNPRDWCDQNCRTNKSFWSSLLLAHKYCYIRKCIL